MILEPYLFSLPKIAGKSGYLSYVEECAELPIDIKRVYWIYGGEEGTTRGDHAHRNADRVMVCLQGSIEVSLESINDKTYSFQLQHPWQALYFPRLHWINLKLGKAAMLLVFASAQLKDDEIIRDYAQFKRRS